MPQVTSVTVGTWQSRRRLVASLSKRTPSGSSQDMSMHRWVVASGVVLGVAALAGWYECRGTARATKGEEPSAEAPDVAEYAASLPELPERAGIIALPLDGRDPFPWHPVRDGVRVVAPRPGEPQPITVE